ncbi:hypothetical protein IAU59_005444 [Kwoniella sp. CBS 9459]
MPSAKSATKPRGPKAKSSKSKSKKSSTAKIRPTPLPFDKFPPEIKAHILSLVPASRIKDVLSMMLVSKKMYEISAPRLYHTLAVNTKNHKAIFAGLDTTLPSRGRKNFSSSSDDFSESEDIEEIEVIETIAKTLQTMPHPLNQLIESKDNKFGLDPLSVKARKIDLLRHTKKLIIQDWPGARAVAVALGLNKNEARMEREDLAYSDGEYDSYNGRSLSKKRTAIIFQQVECLALGLKFLLWDDFCPPCICEWPPLAHPVVCTLSNQLRPKHVCADWGFGGSNHKLEEAFDKHFGFLVNKWEDSLESFTWHNIQNTYHVPHRPYQIPLLRLVFVDCGKLSYLEKAGEDGGAYEDADCHCDDRHAEAMKHQNTKAAREQRRNPTITAPRTVELINLLHLGNSNTKTATDTHAIVQPPVSSKSGSKTPYIRSKRLSINIVKKGRADVCICCGKL